MSYSVKEIFLSLQGEGINTGRVAIFCRFSGCNLWSGKEKDRESSQCDFCDTDFVGTNGRHGGQYQDVLELENAIVSLWPESPVNAIDSGSMKPMVIFTGGEPTLQLDRPLIDALKHRGFFVAIETNGTKEVPQGLDWICVSPKAHAPLKQVSGNELKLVFPQNLDPANYLDFDFEYFSLSPLVSSDKGTTELNTRLAINYCLAHPKWRLTYQLHKVWNIA